MLQVVGGRWPAEWEPHGWGTLAHEPFSSWWQRWAHEFPNLDPRVLEQWVHRHWEYSPYFGFPLQNFRCECERIGTSVLLRDVGSVDDLRPDEPIDLDSIYELFNEPCRRDYEPMKTMNHTGTWNMPVLLVRSPSGLLYREIEFSDFSMWVLEGHQRHRYLRALAARRQAAEHHEALVLSA